MRGGGAPAMFCCVRLARPWRVPSWKLWGGDDDASRSSFSESSEDSPALNRSYKTSFLSLKLPSFGATTVEGQITPDSGTPPFSSTVETRKPSQLNTPFKHARFSPQRRLCRISMARLHC